MLLINDSLAYYLHGAFDESPDGKYWHMGGFKDRVGSMDNFKIVDDRTILVHIKPEYASAQSCGAP